MLLDLLLLLLECCHKTTLFFNSLMTRNLVHSNLLTQ
jgi:hypothetical protein